MRVLLRSVTTAVVLVGVSLGGASCSETSRRSAPPSSGSPPSAVTASPAGPPTTTEPAATSPTTEPAATSPTTAPGPTSPTTAPAPAGTAVTASSSTTAPAPAGPVLPDPAFTPGATNPQVTQATIGRTICTAGWTATVRPPESYTERVKHLEDQSGGSVTFDGTTYQVHGFDLTDPDISHFELDHLVPLELGGSPADPDNLWMEPYEAPKGGAGVGTGSQTKDKVENAAHAAVCAGRLPLAEAQQAMAANWYVFGRQLDAFG